MAKITQVLFVLLAASVIHGEIVKYPDVHKLEICYQPENVPYKVHSLKLNRLEHNFTVSASWEFLEDIDSDDIQVEAFIERCASKEANKSCEKYAQIKPKLNVCSYLTMDFLGIRKVTDSVIPPFRCPFNKNNFTLPDISYDLKDFTLFPLEHYYWKGRVDVYRKEHLDVSVCVEAQVLEVDL